MVASRRHDSAATLLYRRAIPRAITSALFRHERYRHFASLNSPNDYARVS